MKCSYLPDEDIPTRLGSLPVAPFPNVLLPHAVQPLRLVDPIVKQAIRTAVSQNHLFAVLAPGTDIDTNQNVVCIAQVTACHEDDSNGCTAFVRGICRGSGKITHASENRRELIAKAHRVPDRYPNRSAIDRSRRRLELLDAYFQLFPHLSSSPLLDPVLEELPLGGLCDLVACSLKIQNPALVQILQEINVDARSDLVLMSLRNNLRMASEGVFDFPPRFSCN